MKIFNTSILNSNYGLILILFILIVLPLNVVSQEKLSATNNTNLKKNDHPLIMGIFPRRHAKATIKAYTPLAKYLSKKLKREVEIETTYNFASFWKGVKEKKYDIGRMYYCFLCGFYNFRFNWDLRWSRKS